MPSKSTFAPCGRLGAERGALALDLGQRADSVSAPASQTVILPSTILAVPLSPVKVTAAVFRGAVDGQLHVASIPAVARQAAEEKLAAKFAVAQGDHLRADGDGLILDFSSPLYSPWTAKSGPALAGSVNASAPRPTRARRAAQPSRLRTKIALTWMHLLDRQSLVMNGRAKRLF